MNTLYKYWPALLPCFLAMMFGCADLQNNLPTAENGLLKVHPPGWKDTTSANFHGHFIAASRWNLQQCQTCHGRNYAGGTVNVSCRDCHTAATGPEACNTCHGNSADAAPPKDTHGNWTRNVSTAIGAHQVHLTGSPISSAKLCSECHTIPESYGSPGHIDSARATVHFNNPLANTATNEPSTEDYDTSLATVTPHPVYDPATRSCSGSYCHGNFKNGNPGNTVSWNDTTGKPLACGTCHGDTTKATIAERAQPRNTAHGGTHPQSTACFACHADVVGGTNLNDIHIIDPSKHINGRLNVFGDERDF